MISPPAHPSAHPPSPAAPAGKWPVGTLTYTSAGLVSLFVWLLFGDFAWSMRDRSVAPMAQWYLNHLNVPNIVFGLLVSSFPAFIGLILGPVISVKSDRHRSRRGRRIPFLLVTTPIAAFGMIGLAVTPFIARWVHGFFPDQSEMLVAVVCFGVFWAAFEFATIAGQAVFGGLINDVVPAPLLGRFYGLFRAVSLIDGMIFNFWVMGKVPEHFTAILVVIGLFYGAAFTWVCLKVREGEYPPPPPSPSGGVTQGVFHEIRTYCRECFANPYYVSVFVMLMTAGMAFGPINTFSIPYARSMGIDMETYGKFIALTYLISLGLAYFLGWMADAFHPLRMAIITLVGYAIVAAWGGLFAQTPRTFLTAFVLHGVLSGCYFTTAASLGPRLFPHAKFAQFASAAGIFMAIAGIVMAPLLGVFLDRAGTDYRHTFTAGCLLAMIALLSSLHVYRKFIRLGGPRNYVAP
jgi:MFS family permease